MKCRLLKLRCAIFISIISKFYWKEVLYEMKICATFELCDINLFISLEIKEIHFLFRNIATAVMSVLYRKFCITKCTKWFFYLRHIYCSLTCKCFNVSIFLVFVRSILLNCKRFLIQLIDYSKHSFGCVYFPLFSFANQDINQQSLLNSRTKMLFLSHCWFPTGLPSHPKSKLKET